MNETGKETTDTKWNGFYKVGGASALIAVVIVIIEAIIVIIWPPPDLEAAPIIGWFMFVHNNRVVGLIDHMLFDTVVIALLIPMFLALYFALRRFSETWVTIAMPIALVGITAYVTTNNTFSLLFLSDQYAAATTDAQRSMILGSGQALEAICQYGMFYSTGFLFVSIAGLIISIVMLRSNVFNKSTAYVGILANVMTSANFISWFFVPAVHVIPTIFGLGGGLIMFIWWILTGLRLYRLGRLGKNIVQPQS